MEIFGDEMSIQDIYYMATLPFKLLKEITFDVYVLSDGKKKITYVTSVSEGMIPYYTKRLYDSDAEITKVKRIYIWELRKFVDRQDEVMVDIYRPLARFLHDGILVPSYVNQVLDIDKKTIDEVIKIDKNNLKRVKKYRHEISNDYEDLKFFYKEMYVPHAKRRYGNYAHIENFYNIEKIFKNGGLVFITFEGERVAASLDQMIGDTYFLCKAGIINDDFIKKGALVASYYFSILRAKEVNAKIVDFGTSLPFLLDGVLRHKNNWGTRIVDDNNHKRFVYLKNVSFEQPFIYIEDKKLKTTVKSKDHKLVEEYSMSGLEFNIE